MPLPEDQKDSTPFKSMDIKTLFLAANCRKRKASSPIPTANEAKAIKICDKESDDDIQILPSPDAILVGDSKENKDLNTVQNEQESLVNGITQPKENDMNSIKKEYQSNLSCDDSNKGSSDDNNSSELNSSINPLNTSGILEANQDKNNTETVNNASNTDSCANVASETKPITVKEKDQSNSNSKKRKRMTPEEAKQRAEERERKQQERLLKKQEIEAKKQERERELQQRKLQKELEKKAKDEEKKEKERQRQEKKEQEEKEKQMKLEKLESQKKMRQMQLEQKLEMKKQKEEMKQKQEEERKKAEEQKRKADLEKEQKEKEKKERAKAAFVKFFVKENTSPPPPIQKAVEQEGVFKPFQISEDMILAPVVPSVAQERFNREILDAALKSQSDTELYLQILKAGSHCDVRLRKRQRKPRLCDADVIIADKNDETEFHSTAKLLQFCENVRPPYRGTWRKKSKNIRPRNPFGQDDIFDYSVDSDDEWDEGGPGESLSGTEQEDESEDDYEVDNEFFVPHGYLSAEEEKEDDEEGKEDEVVNDPEKQKALLKKKLQEFEMERKKKTTELKPIILGCYIENNENSQNFGLRSLLEPYSVVFLTDNPIPTSFTVKKLQNESKPNSATSSPAASTSSASKLKKCPVPEEAMPHLIRLMHGNSHGLAFLLVEFQKFWQQHCQNNRLPEKLPQEKIEAVTLESSPNAVPESLSVDAIISKRQLTMTIKQIAVKRTTEATKKPVWLVNEETRIKYGLLDAAIPNTWTYITNINKEEVDIPPPPKPFSVSIKEFLSP